MKNDKPVLTKAELVDRVASSSDLPRKQAEEVVSVFLESIVESLQGGDKVELRGFGSFRLRKRNSRIGRNPRTGEKVAVPPKMIPYFKPGKELKELINQDGEKTDDRDGSSVGDQQI